MHKALRYALIGASTLVALAGGAFGALYYWVSHPAQARQPLPAELISLESAPGKTLLAESTAKVDHAPLESHFQAQEKLSWCGVASSVVVLNSLPTSHNLAQDGFFNECVAQIRPSLRVTFGGIPLETMARMMKCHGVETEVHFADSSSLVEFRKLVAENLRTPGNFVIVNYDRSGVGQQPGGHISPVSAYHEAEDRFLVLDVAHYKYPAVWVKADTLWRAMQTTDGESKRSRGFVLVSGPKAGAANPATVGK